MQQNVLEIAVVPARAEQAQMRGELADLVEVVRVASECQFDAGVDAEF